MSHLFEYFVKSAAGYKPDSHMREGAYARAAAQSPGGVIRSSTIGHQGLSKRTAAQLRRTHNLPAPGQQPTGPDSHMREGAYARAAAQSPGGVIRDTASANPSPAPRPTAPQTQPATVTGAPPAKPSPAAAVNPNSNLGWVRNKMLGHVRENATGYDDPLAQAYGALRQYKTDAELQQGLRQGYQAQLNGRRAGTTDYLNDPHYNLFKYFQGATTIDNAGWDRSQWGHSMQQGALDNAWQD